MPEPGKEKKNSDSSVTPDNEAKKGTREAKSGEFLLRPDNLPVNDKNTEVTGDQVFMVPDPQATPENASWQTYPEYVVDPRPLCQGMPFVLTDAAHPRIVLKYGSHFLVLDEAAVIPDCNTLGYGYYRFDTRHISQWEITLNDTPLVFLSSACQKGYAGTFLYTNAQMGDIPQQKITMQREVVLDDLLWERIVLENFHSQPIKCQLKIKFQSDFADMFEVRGINLPARGERMIPFSTSDKRKLYLAYKGQDGVLLETIVEISGLQPTFIERGEITFDLDLPLKQKQQIDLCVLSLWDGEVPTAEMKVHNFVDAKESADRRYHEWRRQGVSITSDNELFDLFLEGCFRDLYILRQPTPKGWGVGAGIPWYCAVFGRDSAITGLQTSAYLPNLSKESLAVLAAYQGKRDDAFKEEQAGKIMHELRLGELARSNLIPHNPYYGTVDATPLWLLLFCDYINWTGDLGLAQEMWPAIKQALAFLERNTPIGYLTYMRTHDKGLVNQGWKDSDDSVMYLDGTLAEPPIAICEAQAYLYAAKQELSKIAEVLGHKALANRLRVEAAELKRVFQEDFWMEGERFVAMALDGQRRKVRSIASNAGHCLFTGILDDDKAMAVADRLMHHDLQSGWGIRTLSEPMVAFSPISYHNGSIWPHDNAIIAEGLRKYGRMQDVHRILLSLFQAVQHTPFLRLPELFCGFDRNHAVAPIDYPVSCSPQAWAAGSMLQILKACLGLEPDALNKRLRIVEPALPEWLGKVTVKGLKIGGAELDLGFSTTYGSTYCQILRKVGDVKVIIES